MSSNCIEQVPIFSSLSSAEMLEVARITQERTFAKGELIYSAGDKREALFVIHKGQVKISRLSDIGKEQVIRVLGPGDFMGELALFSHSLMTDNAQALEDCTMCVIEGPRLMELMRKYPTIALKVMEELSQRLERAENLIEDISLHSAERRLAKTLLDLSKETGEVQLTLTKGDFASQIGMTQETLSRKLSAFEEGRLIRQVGHRRIVVLNREGLEDLGMD